MLTDTHCHQAPSPIARQCCPGAGGSKGPKHHPMQEDVLSRIPLDIGDAKAWRDLQAQAGDLSCRGQPGPLPPALPPAPHLSNCSFIAAP